MSRFVLVPLTRDAANAFVGIEHRHNKKGVVGHLFAIGALCGGGQLIGVAIVGRTTGRWKPGRARCELTRLATNGEPGSCSFLYSKAKRAAQALGYLSCKTYTRANDESGASLRAVGACCELRIKARGWAEHSKKRPRTNTTEVVDRFRWELIPQERAS